MAWVESHTVLARHRKALLVAHDLKIPVVSVVGHLHVLWHTVLEQQEDGDLSEWPDGMIEEAALWEGKPGELIASLRTRGWIDGHLVHDWLDYTAKFLHSKYSTSNVQKLKDIYTKHGYKYGKGNGKYGKVKAQEKRKKSADQVRSPNQPNQPNLTEPKKEEVSVSQVVELWNGILGVKPCSRELTGFVADRIKREIARHPVEEWWGWYFAQVAESDFLCGRTTDFQATIDWVLGPKNMAKVLAGNYRNKSSPVARRCEERVQRGNFLKQCGEPSVGAIGGRPLCQPHKEQHESRTHSTTA